MSNQKQYKFLDIDGVGILKSELDKIFNNSEQSLKKYSDNLNQAMDSRVKAVENTSHTHTNSDVLNGITSGKVNNWSTAYNQISSVFDVYTHCNDELADVLMHIDENATNEAKDYVASQIKLLPNTYYTEAEIDNKVNALNSSINGKANSSHTHAISDVSNLQDALDERIVDLSVSGKTITYKRGDNTTGTITTQDTVYTHPNSGVTAGTYKSVTVDAKGHVTAGSNPTTLAGYGITNAPTKDEMSTAIGTHNTSKTSHSDIRDEIETLTERLNAVANSTDTDLDQLAEIVTYIKNNKDLIDGVTTKKVNVEDIINNLTTNVTNKPLSAAQGVVLKELIDALEDTKVDTVTTTGTGNAVTSISKSGDTVTVTKGATFLTAHPTVSKSTDTTSTASPKHGETFTVVDGVTRDSNGHVTKINTKTVTMPNETAETPLSKGTDTTGGTQTLNFGESFTVVTDTAVSGHKITDQNTTFTLPSDRLFTTLTPTGTSIPEGADLNTLDYLRVGRYFCAKNTTAKSLQNCPVDTAFMMEVSSPLSTTIDNEANGTWVYRLRKITHYKTGMAFTQFCSVSGTAGAENWTYESWNITPISSFSLDDTDNNSGSASKGGSTRPVYVNSSGKINACTYDLKASVPADAKFTDTVYTHPSYVAITGAPTANQTPAFGDTFNVTQPISDSTGHIVEMNNRTVTIPKTEATESVAGLMSAADKAKLNGIADNANKYTHPTSAGNKHIPSGGATNQILRWSSNGTAVWSDENDTKYTLGSFGVTATASELNKLDGVTATTAELNHVAGVTSGIQGQLDSKVPNTRTVNGKALSGNITLSYTDVGAAESNHNHDNVYSKQDHTHNLSVLNNNAGFITKAVSDLTNYYKKTETYTKDEVNGLISAIPKFSISVVSTLPTSNISTTTIYLLSSGQETNNIYTEYIYVNNKWEKLGEQKVDLSGYAQKTEVSQSISDLNTTLTGLISAETNARTEALKEKAHTFTVETTGSGNAVTNVSYSNNKITATKGATYLTAHPSITKETDSTSKVSPAHQESFTTIDSVTRDSNGHVTKLNTKTVTLPAETQLSKGTDSNTTATLTHGGTFTVLTDVAVDGHKITDHTKTFTMPSETVLSKGTDTSDTAQALKFGDTFTVMVDTAVDGHKITDKNKTFTMPSFPAAGSDLGGVKTGGDVTISNGVITVKDDSHNHVISNVDGLQDTLNSKANKNTGVFYIEGTGDTAGTWLGSHSDIGSYYSGLMIAYKVGIAGADGTTLNINNLGAIAVKMNASTAVTTHYGVNSVLFLVYTVDSDGVGYWKLADYNSDKKVSQYSTTTNAKYPMLFKYTSGNTSTSTVTNYVRFNNNIYYNPSGGVLTAPKFEGAVIGNADTASAVQTSSGNLKFWKGTKAEYDAIATKDASCLYIVTDDMPVKQTWTLTMTDGRIIEKDVILYD